MEKLDFDKAANVRAWHNDDAHKNRGVLLRDSRAHGVPHTTKPYSVLVACINGDYEVHHFDNCETLPVMRLATPEEWALWAESPGAVGWMERYAGNEPQMPGAGYEFDHSGEYLRAKMDPSKKWQGWDWAPFEVEEPSNGC